MSPLRVKRLFKVSRPAALLYQRYDLIFTVLLIGSVGIISCFFSLLVLSYWGFGNAHILDRVLICFGALCYLGGVYVVWRSGRKWLAALFLAWFYGILASTAIVLWGINAPIGHLLLAITIILSGILLGSRYTLYAATIAIILLFSVQIAVLNGYTPTESPALSPSHFGDVVGYGMLHIVLAMIAWLFGYQVERLLIKNQEAEEALLKEKELLETRVEERTTELQAVQFEEMQYLYQFAEVGQLSTAVLHDLANHLTVLTFDIEDLGSERSGTLKRARHSIKYLDHMVKQARGQLQDTTKSHRFNAVARLHKSVQIVSQKAEDNDVELEVVAPSHRVLCMGDPSRFNQVVSILMTNSIESYISLPPEKIQRKVLVEMLVEDSQVKIIVKDWGVGISAARRGKLFEPFNSTKKTGMGIGLFIARQLAVTHFKGTLQCVDKPSDAVTEFIFTLPKES